MKPPAWPSPLELPHTLEIAGHRLTLFEDVAPLIQAMTDDLRSAERRAWVESYIFADDHVGRAAADALVDRAAAGVSARVMYDAVGSLHTPSAFFDGMSAAGVDVHAFHTVWDSLWQFSLFRMLNRRDHRKLAVVDDHIAYFGGMNLIDAANPGGQSTPSFPSSAGWRDLHVRLEGPRAGEIGKSMDRLWWSAKRNRKSPAHRWKVEGLLETNEDAFAFFDADPRSRSQRAQRVLLPLIRRAKKTITLAMAYFIPVGRLLRALIRARKRGVHIRVIVPAESDVPVVRRACRHLYGLMIKHRFQIFERQDRMLHSKLMVVDGRWTLIGSCNLDPRSMVLNLEFLSLIHSLELAELVEDLCRYEIQHSVRVTREMCSQRSFWTQLADRAAWSVRRFL